MIHFTKKWCILVVDDEEGLREVLATSIMMWGGEPLKAANGTEALQILEQHDVDLVLTDVRMPGGDGVDLLEAIRKKYPGKPMVVMMSGYTEQSQGELIKKGAMDFLKKPFPLNKLGEKLAQVLD